MAFQKTEAELNGFDEALVLTPDGHASEASAANLFIVRDGCCSRRRSATTSSRASRARAIIQLATDAGIPIEVRAIDRSELYVADEVFMCGTGVQV